MTTPLRSLLLLACAVPFAALADPAPMTSPLPYPPTKAVPVEQTLHGETFTDPYQWLEDGKAPDVQEWMSAQDGLTRKTLAAIPERAGFEARVKQLIYVDSIGVPFRRGDRLFFSEKKKDQEKAVIYWRPVKGGEAKVVLDPLQFAADGTTSIGSYSPSWDGKLVAYQVKPNNSDTARYEVREVDTGKVLTRDTIEGGRYAGAEWTQDNKAFYYTSYPTDPAIPVDQRPGKTEVRFHVLGTDPATDKVIHPAMNDASVFHSGSLSWDGRWLTLAIDHGWTRNDVLVMDLHAKEPKFVPVFEGKDALFRVDVWKDKMYVWSTQGSPRGALWTVDLLAKDPAAAAAQKLIIPERKDHAIEGFALVGGRLALNTLVDAASRLELYELSGKKVMEVKLPGIGSASGLSGDPRYHEAYFQFESFTYPSEVRELDVKTGKSKVVFKIAVPIKPEDFEVRQIFGTSKDGTRVPVFITQKKGLPKDGQAPTIL
ncbi:MAG: S9 family peptidase, partial [Deltaproteobacteria bacterium]|nr:S9 family peptidase [Deltaproteobacteria bacterium]